MNWNKYIERYENELKNSVIPFWEKNCIDREFGGYLVNLDRDGSCYDYTKYMWMQWRVVYVFGELYLDKKYTKPQYLEIAEAGFDFLYRHGKDENGQYYFALNRQGVPAIAPYNVFSDCFAVMGAAKLYQATGKPIYAEAAKAAMNSYTRRIKSGKSSGQWDKALSGKPAYLSLGHYMMLANLGLIMDEVMGGNEYEKELDAALDIVLNKFYHPEYGLVFENILADGSIDKDSCAGRMINPGHVLEAMWFLLNALEKRGGNPELEAKIYEIILKDLEFGYDKKFGGIFYFMDAFGKPHLELQHDMKLWWVHNEALICCLFAYKRSHDRRFLDWFKKLDRWTWKHFPDPKYGEWYGYLNRRGEPTHLLKGGKWKTFFHLPRCLMMCSKLMQEISSAK